MFLDVGLEIGTDEIDLCDEDMLGKNRMKYYRKLAET